MAQQEGEAPKRVPLLDDDGELTPKFEDALAYIFQKYCTVPTASSEATEGTATPAKKQVEASSASTHKSSDTASPSASQTSFVEHPATPPSKSATLGSRPPKGAVISDVGLDKFAYDTNGAPFPEDSKEEMKQFLDCDDEGRLTFEGFLGLYHLQSDNDPNETWKDLSTHGFQSDLNLVSTRREDAADDGKQAQAAKTADAATSSTTKGDATTSPAATGAATLAATAAAEEDAEADDPLKTVLVPLHVKHILKLSSNTSSLAYHLSTHLRMNGVYWGLSALELMGRGDELRAEELVDFVMSCWDSQSGGFGSFPKHDAHILSTLSAIQILAIKDRLDVLDREKVIQYILSLQNPTTSLFYGDSTHLEEDTRFLYCALNALSLLGALDRLPSRRQTIRGILACANFDGGFGRVRGSESHSGQVFVCVAALAILRFEGLPLRRAGEGGGEGEDATGAASQEGSLADAKARVQDDPEPEPTLDVPKLTAWLSERQLPNGGLNGRPQKLEDVCYSWWVLSALSVLGKLHWIDRQKLAGFILSAQDPDSGGLSDRPGNVSDVFHTFFGLAGLSLLSFTWTPTPTPTQGSSIGNGSGSLRPVDPVYGMPADVIARLGPAVQRGYQVLGLGER